MSGLIPPYGTFQFAAMRLTKVDNAGNPRVGSNLGYFHKGVVDAKIDVDIESGDEDTLKRGDGQICQTSKEDDIIKAATLDLNLCSLDAQAIHFLTGSTLYSDSGVPMGYQILGPDDAAANGVIFEGWSKAWDGDNQAAPTILSGAVAYWHWVLPWFKGQIGAQTLDRKHNSVPITGRGTTNSEATVNGPYDDWPSWVSLAGGVTRPYGVFIDSLPVTAEGLLNVTALAS